MNADIRWLDNPEVFRINQMAAHSDHDYYLNYEDMSKQNQKLVQSLNGQWSFCFSKNAKSRPVNFFEESYDINIKTVINRIYHDTQVSRYFASFAKFAYKNIENQYIQDLCSRCFDEFIDNFIIIYEHAKETEIGFVGSIAYYFRDIIKCRLETKGLKPGEIIKDPIDGLVEFHSK